MKLLLNLGDRLLKPHTPLPCHVDGQFEYRHPWHSEALRIGLRDMPR